MTIQQVLEEAARRLLKDHATMLVAAYSYDNPEKRERGFLRASAYLNSAHRVLEMISEIEPTRQDQPGASHSLEHPKGSDS